jgi:fumarate hydratase subunit beta
MMHIKTPIYEDTIKRMKAGDIVYISGTIYTGRDQAHKKMVEAIHNDQPLPFDFTGQIIYYVGPTPAKSGQPIGSCGPTSSYRMDPFAKPLMEKGLKVMIGKGHQRDD